MGFGSGIFTISLIQQLVEFVAVSRRADRGNLGTQAGIDDAVKNDGGDDADSADKGDPQNAAANNEGDEVAVPETQVPQAPEFSTWPPASRKSRCITGRIS